MLPVLNQEKFHRVTHGCLLPVLKEARHLPNKQIEYLSVSYWHAAGCHIQLLICVIPTPQPFPKTLIKRESHLPTEAVGSTSLQMFKARIDESWSNLV